MRLQQRIEKLERPPLDIGLVLRRVRVLARQEGLDPDEVVESTKALLDRYMPLYGADVDGILEAMARDKGLNPDELRQEVDRMLKEARRWP